jgi:hypothetical protein
MADEFLALLGCNAAQTLALRNNPKERKPHLQIEHSETILEETKCMITGQLQ